MNVEEIRLFRKAVRRLQRDLGWQWKTDAACCGVTVTQCHALLEVAEHEEISLAELAAILGLDRSTLSRTVDGMFREGLVGRCANPGDRRYISISLTGRGRSVCEEINHTFDDYFNGVFEHIPVEQRRQVLKSFLLLTEAVELASGVQCCNKGESERQ